MRRFRGFFARRDDPYAGGDLDNAQRISAVLWGVLVVLTVGLLPASPPVDPTKGSAWAITVILIALGAILVAANRRRQIKTWGTLLATGYGIVAGIAVMQWVSGG